MRAPIGAAEERAMLANVSKTLTTAADVLEHLHGALVRSGFVSGLPAYRSMCDLLLGQRLWSLPRADDRLRAQFEQVAARAAAVGDILKPYAEMMERLGTIGTMSLAASPTPPRPPETARDRVVAALGASGQPMTLTALARAVATPRKAVGVIVEDLIASETVEATRAGRRTLYRLRRQTGSGSNGRAGPPGR